MSRLVIGSVGVALMFVPDVNNIAHAVGLGGLNSVCAIIVELHVLAARRGA